MPAPGVWRGSAGGWQPVLRPAPPPAFLGARGCHWPHRMALACTFPTHSNDFLLERAALAPPLQSPAASDCEHACLPLLGGPLPGPVHTAGMACAAGCVCAWAQAGGETHSSGGAVLGAIRPCTAPVPNPIFIILPPEGRQRVSQLCRALIVSGMCMQRRCVPLARVGAQGGWGRRTHAWAVLHGAHTPAPAVLDCFLWMQLQPEGMVVPGSADARRGRQLTPWRSST